MKKRGIAIFVFLIMMWNILPVFGVEPARVLEPLANWTPKFYNKNNLPGESAQDGEKRIFSLAKGESYDGSDAMYIRYESTEALVSTWGGYTNNSVGAVPADLASGVWGWEPNTAYQISFVFKTKRIASSTHDPFIKVFFGNWVQNKTNNSNYVSTTGLTETQIAAGWRKFNCTYTTTEEIRNTEIFNMQMPGEYWIDDVSLKKVSDGKELIYNGTFTPYQEPVYYFDGEGIEGWSVSYGLKGVDGKLETDNGSTRMVRVANGLAAKGYRSLYIKYWSDSTPISWDGGKTYDVYQGGITIRNTDFVPEAGKAYTLSYLMRNEGTSKLLFWIGGAKLLSSSATPTTEGLTVTQIKEGWKRYTHSFTTTSSDPFSITVNYINTWQLDEISIVAKDDTEKRNLISPVASNFEGDNGDGVYAGKAYLFDESGYEVTRITEEESEQTLTAGASVVNISKKEPMEVSLVAALYQGEQSIMVAMSDGETVSEGEGVFLRKSFTLPKLLQDQEYTVKIFVWNMKTGKPLRENRRTVNDAIFGNTVIFGDSYSTFEGYLPQGNSSWYQDGGSGSTDVTHVSQTWWYPLMNLPGNRLLLNDSWSGTTVCHTGYYGEDVSDKSFVTRVDRLIEAGYFTENQVDTIFIFGGTNDSWAGSPVGNLKYDNWTETDLYDTLSAFCYILQRLQNASPDSRIVCMIGAMLTDDIKEGYYEACRHYGATPVILDVTDVFSSHPTQKGMRQIKDQILEKIQ
ncbi:MAG: hypothetical protein IKW60_04755 [Clostridia bacterium]|nr:hypothetical protein [Clostridia bacterium]